MKTIDFLVQELPKLGGWPDGAIGAGFLCGEGTLYFWDESNDCPTKWRVDTETEVEDSASKISRDQYEAALAAKNDSWIEWGGGECPVDTKTLVDIRLKVGFTYKSCHPGDYSWRHAGGGGDIVAYRLHKPQEVTKADDEADLNECIGHDVAPVWSGEGLPPVGCECEWQDKNTKQWNPVKVVYASEWVTVIREINKEKGDDLVEIAIENYGDDARLKFRPTRSEAERKRHDAAQALCSAGGGNGGVDEKAGYGSCWFDIYDAIAAGKIPGVKLED